MTAVDFTVVERGMIEICLLNRIDEIDETEAKGYHPDGNNEIRNTYLAILEKLGRPNVEYRR